MNVNFSTQRADHKKCAQIYQKFKMINALKEANSIPVFTKENVIQEVFVYESVIPKNVFRYSHEDKMFLDPLQLKKSIHNSIIFWGITFFLVLMIFWILALLINPIKMHSISARSGFEVVLLSSIFVDIVMFFRHTLPYRKFFQDIYVNRSGVCNYSIDGSVDGKEVKMFSLDISGRSFKGAEPFNAKRNGEIREETKKRYHDFKQQERQSKMQNDPQFKEKVASAEKAAKKAKKYGILAGIFFGGCLVCLIYIIIAVVKHGEEYNNFTVVYILVALLILAMVSFLNYTRLFLSHLE